MSGQSGLGLMYSNLFLNIWTQALWVVTALIVVGPFDDAMNNRIFVTIQRSNSAHPLRYKTISKGICNIQHYV